VMLFPLRHEEIAVFGSTPNVFTSRMSGEVARHHAVKSSMTTER
jgi:hypothetical protein